MRIRGLHCRKEAQAFCSSFWRNQCEPLAFSSKKSSSACFRTAILISMLRSLQKNHHHRDRNFLLPYIVHLQQLQLAWVARLIRLIPVQVSSPETMDTS
uniref:Uncharacterized protein n=1 Tax=Rhizophora mucronata TaxID=61149 RepID=A0A2P2KRT2_RHIMU